MKPIFVWFMMFLLPVMSVKELNALFPLLNLAVSSRDNCKNVYHLISTSIHDFVSSFPSIDYDINQNIRERREIRISSPLSSHHGLSIDEQS